MIIYNGVNSFTEYGLYVASRELPVPTRKEITETVPYMSGEWDFSYHDDDIDEYETLKIKYTFDVIADTKQELHAQRDILLAWAHSRGDQMLYDTDISENQYYKVYKAQAGWSANDLQGLLTVEFSCYPFKKTDKKVSQSLSDTATTLTIKNGGSRKIYPTIKIASKNIVQEYTVSDNATQYASCLCVEADLKPNTVYTISFEGASGHNIYLNENLFVETGFYLLTGERQSITVTTKSDISTEKSSMYASYGWIIAKNRGGNTVTPSFSNVQFELGDTMTEYTPYVEATATIKYGANSSALGEGTYKGNFTLEKGENTFIVSGAGELTFIYAEENF